MQLTGQEKSKTPNMKPIEEKFKQIAPDAGKKVCEFEYMKYMKSLGFLLLKCYKTEHDPKYLVGIKPY